VSTTWDDAEAAARRLQAAATADALDHIANAAPMDWDEDDSTTYTFGHQQLLMGLRSTAGSHEHDPVAGHARKPASPARTLDQSSPAQVAALLADSAAEQAQRSKREAAAPGRQARAVPQQAVARPGSEHERARRASEVRVSAHPRPATEPAQARAAAPVENAAARVASRQPAPSELPPARVASRQPPSELPPARVASRQAPASELPPAHVASRQPAASELPPARVPSRQPPPRARKASPVSEFAPAGDASHQPPASEFPPAHAASDRPPTSERVRRHSHLPPASDQAAAHMTSEPAPSLESSSGFTASASSELTPARNASRQPPPAQLPQARQPRSTLLPPPREEPESADEASLWQPAAAAHSPHPDELSVPPPAAAPAFAFPMSDADDFAALRAPRLRGWQLWLAPAFVLGCSASVYFASYLPLRERLAAELERSQAQADQHERSMAALRTQFDRERAALIQQLTAAKASAAAAAEAAQPSSAGNVQRRANTGTAAHFLHADSPSTAEPGETAPADPAARRNTRRAGTDDDDLLRNH
jgi:hypothetical protein